MQDRVASTYYEWLSSLTQGLKECMVFEIITVKCVSYAITKAVQSHLVSCVVAALVF